MKQTPYTDWKQKVIIIIINNYISNLILYQIYYSFIYLFIFSKNKFYSILYSFKQTIQNRVEQNSKVIQITY